VIADSEPGGPEFGETVPAPENTKARDDLESVLADLEIQEPMGVEDAVDAGAPALEVPADVAAEIPAAPVAEEAPAVDGAAEVDPEPAAVEEPEAVPPADLLSEIGAEPDASTETGFEGGGSDIANLTCDDCVYMNTCPKVGDSDPSSCGSFQWKSS
jgi:hypothetical protein